MTTSPAPQDLIDGRYEVLRTLGSGSFGQTLLARPVETGEKVAIKALHADKVESLKAFEMFEREAVVLGKLRHQGVPAIVDSFHASWKGSETAFLVMEFMEGPTLEELIAQQHSFSTEEVLTLIMDLAGILQYLHERVPPILHRDIKPANVILRNGRTPALVDFGAVRNVFRTPDESGSTVVGTYGYMPYEQYMGQATPPSDLYALGATMLHVLTGRPPSEFLSDQGRLEVPDHVPGGNRVRTILERLLAPAAAERFQSAHELRRAILDPDGATGRSRVPVAKQSSLPNVKRSSPVLDALPPTPRALKGATLEQLRKTAPSAFLLMATPTRPGATTSAASKTSFVLGSIFSLGIAPLIYWLMSAHHRGRLKPFFVNGKPAVGRIQSIATANPGERSSRITYEFEGEDGTVHRGIDQVFTPISDLWRVGDAIAVLYLPERNFESVIVSAT